LILQRPRAILMIHLNVRSLDSAQRLQQRMANKTLLIRPTPQNRFNRLL
jgi:hypothetical protein